MANKTITTNGTTWKGTSAKDTVHIELADNVSVNTAGGNDSVHNYLSRWSTINTGADNNTIILEAGNYSSINAGAGSKVNINGTNYTISGKTLK